MEWTLLEQATAETMWNDALAQFPDCNVHQSFEWGEYRRRSGVTPMRWAAVDDAGTVRSLFQGMLVRKVGNVGVVVGDGGPVGDLEGSLHLLQDAVASSLGLKHLYCRIYPKRPYCAEDALLFKTCGWQRALATFSSGWSMALDLKRDPPDILADFSKNHRKNLRKAAKTDLVLEPWREPDPAQIVALYREMESLKDLGQQFAEGDIKEVLETFGDNLILYRATDPHGATLSLRGCLTVGGSALDWFAATSEAGRQTPASHALLWALLQACKARGVELYDLNGIDPANNPGVFRFKKGTGAQPLEYLGEWDWATSETLRLAMNAARSNRTSLKGTSLKGAFRATVRKVKQILSPQPQEAS